MSNIAIYDPNDATVAGRVTSYVKSANTPDYDGESNKVVNPDLSALSSVPQKHWKHSAGSIVEMSATEKEAADGGSALDLNKKQKKAAIDQRTTELIDAGFTHASTTFSLSMSAQRNWNTLYNHRGHLTYPKKISTKDDGEHSLTDAAALDLFYDDVVSGS